MSTYFFEDFAADTVFTSGGRTITEADLTFFSMLSGDWNAIHADEEYAKRTRYGRRVVHGAFGIAVATGMLHELGIFEKSAVAMINLKEWRFLAPMFVGDTIHLELGILGSTPGRSGQRGTVHRRFRLINQDGVTAQEGESDVLVLTRAGATPGAAA